MIELHVVKGPVEECLVLENDDNNKLGRGCKGHARLVMLWDQAIVCADTNFASVQAACCPFVLSFWLIGVVKMATKLFPKQNLGKVELPICGTMVALTAVHDEVELLAFVYCDHDHHYLSQLILTLQVAIQFIVQGCNN
jgi:hypothetical protein